MNDGSLDFTSVRTANRTVMRNAAVSSVEVRSLVSREPIVVRVVVEAEGFYYEVDRRTEEVLLGDAHKRRPVAFAFDLRLDGPSAKGWTVVAAEASAARVAAGGPPLVSGSPVWRSPDRARPTERSERRPVDELDLAVGVDRVQRDSQPAAAPRTGPAARTGPPSRPPRARRWCPVRPSSAGVAARSPVSRSVPASRVKPFASTTSRRPSGCRASMAG